MAKSLGSKKSFLALLVLFLIVAASEMRVAEAKYCWKKSEKWTGPCLQSYKCSQHCKYYWAYTKYGICQKQKWGNGWTYSCVCYYPC